MLLLEDAVRHQWLIHIHRSSLCSNTFVSGSLFRKSKSDNYASAGSEYTHLCNGFFTSGHCDDIERFGARNLNIGISCCEHSRSQEPLNPNMLFTNLSDLRKDFAGPTSHNSIPLSLQPINDDSQRLPDPHQGKQCHSSHHSTPLLSLAASASPLPQPSKLSYNPTVHSSPFLFLVVQVCNSNLLVICRNLFNGSSVAIRKIWIPLVKML